jgi:hypothetical protein
MKEKILKIIENKPKHFSKMVKTRPDLMNWVESNTQVSTENLSEKIYSALYNCTNECKYGNKKKFNSINEGYRFCGPTGKCACAAESVSEKVSLVKSNYSESRRKEIAETRKQTVIERYGVTNSGQTTFAKKRHKEYYDNLERKSKPKKLTSFQRLNLKFKKLSNVELVTDESDYKGVSNQAYYRFKCNKCENIFDDYIDNGHLPKCDICHPYIPTYTSKQETEVYEYIKTITNKVVKQTDKSLINPYEIDILIPELKIAIEYCGLYWHSDAYKADKNYHLNKLNLCNKKGYRLITIFEDEWVKKRSIVENRLKNILGCDSKIYARQCKVMPVTLKVAEDFVKQNHIQGHAISKFAYGCFYNDVLVAVMTFGIPRYDKTVDYELIRYCSLGTVVGGAGKLFAEFRRKHNPNSVVSYCDMRWGTGDLYKKLNFIQESSKQNPGYSYTDFVNRYHRSTFTKKKISTSENSNKTESQIMRERKIYRIWDCGQTKWVYREHI